MDTRNLIKSTGNKLDCFKSSPKEQQTPHENQPEKVNYAEDENKERGNWSGRLDFILSCIGFAVGLGNVWRFPYRAAQNGGASFLIPYVVMLVFAGLPLFFMELAMGQFSSLGPISVWKVVPFFKGLGYAMVVISGLVCIYYNMIIAYTLLYFFYSLNTEVPWSKCKQEWIDEYHCVDHISTNETRSRDEWCDTMGNTTFTNDTGDYTGHALWDNYTHQCLTPKASPAKIFWERVVLDISEGIDVGADVYSYKLVLCLLLAWIIVSVCLIKGIKSSGKVVYFTATFPYVVLVILLIRNATLEGAIEGIKFYMIPKWERLLDYKVWNAAAIQIFYSLGVAFGSLETMASYNRFHNNVYRDAVIVAVLNCATSVFAGFVIFSVTGFMAVQTGQSVEAVANAGPGLTFIAYPEGIAMMPGAPFWAVLFFLMIFTLGLDSQFAMMETVVSAICDEFPLFQVGSRKVALNIFLCTLFFLLGLPQCARNGVYIMNLFDWYSAGFSLMIVSLLEVTAISWIYGLKKFAYDIELMLGFRPNMYWIVNWTFITPALILAMLIVNIVLYSPATYGTAYEYPAWADGIGWIMVGLALVFIPLLALIEYCKARTSLSRVSTEHANVSPQTDRSLTRKKDEAEVISTFSDIGEVMATVFNPEKDWGPALPQHRLGIYASHSNEAFEPDNPQEGGRRLSCSLPPASTQPWTPSQPQPAQPGPTEPAQPGPTEPAQPGSTEPAQPGPTEPAQPGSTEPAQPGPTEPAQPGPTVESDQKESTC